MAIFQTVIQSYVLNGDGSSTTFSYPVPSAQTIGLVGSPTRISAIAVSNFPAVKPPLAFGNAPDAWQPNTSYAVGALFAVNYTPSQGGEQYIAECTTAGISGSSIPFNLSIEPAQVGDGSVVWSITKLSSSLAILDVPAVSVVVSNKGIVTLSFSHPLFQAGATVTDRYGNVLPVGSYAISVAYFYDGN